MDIIILYVQLGVTATRINYVYIVAGKRLTKTERS